MSLAASESRIRTRRRQYLVLGVLFAVLLLTIAVSCSLGDKAIPLQTVWDALLGKQAVVGTDEAVNLMIVRDIRLPRTIVALLVGGALAISGAVMQAIFRNPLADPGLVGVSAGGALGAVVFIVMGSWLIPASWLWAHKWGLTLFPMVGGILVTFLVYYLSRVNKRTNVTTMLLTGIAINALVGAVIGYSVYLSDDNQLRDFTFWSLGSLAHANWTMLLFLGPLVAVLVVFVSFYPRELNLLLLGEAEAVHLGVNVERTRRRLIFATAAVVGLTVALCGMIGFVGLVTPHLCRLLLGPDHRSLLPASVMLGGVLLGLSDLLARIIIAYSELPVGVVTATIGAPFFLYLIVISKRSQAF